ncbi:MAG: electron transfer flavoprotein subunit beta/FixA family protein [Tenacibaculum sp.]
MKILACISHVPDTTSKINFTDNNTKFDTNGVQFVINPYDEFTLTRAMWFKEKQGAVVTVVNVGDFSTESTLRKALAIGADSAIRVNAVPADGLMVAKELAEVVKNGAYDLVLAGKESADYNGQMVPGMLASLLNYNFVNGCVGIEINGTEANIEREIDGGEEKLISALPLVVAGQKGIVEEKDLRIPNMRGIMMARKKPLKVVEPIGTKVATTTQFFEKPKPKGAVKLADSIDQLIDLLHSEAKVL